MIKELASTIVMANKAAQAAKSIKGGARNVERGLQRSAPKQSPAPSRTFKNVRTPSNTPGGMKAWRKIGEPTVKQPGKAVVFRKTKAHPEGARRVVNATPLRKKK